MVLHRQFYAILILTGHVEQFSPSLKHNGEPLTATHWSELSSTWQHCPSWARTGSKRNELPCSTGVAYDTRQRSMEPRI